MALSDADLAKRIGHITSSTAAGCLGLDERITQTGAWLLIMGKTTKPKNPHIVARQQKAWRKACDRGDRLEYTILEYPCDDLSERFAVAVVMTPAPFRRHPKYDWAADSCDALYWPDTGPVDPSDPYGGLLAIGEGKSASMGVAKAYGEDYSDEMPYHTLVQAHFHLAHWPEVDLCVVPVLVGGHRFEYRLLEVRRDPEFEGCMMEDLARWHHDYVIGNKMPPCDEWDDAHAKNLHPSGRRLFVPDSPEMKKAAFGKLREARTQKAAAGRESVYKCQLIHLLGEGDECKAEWGRVTNRAPASSWKVDWELVSQDLMRWFCMTNEERTALIGRCTEQKDNGRRLNVYPTKETRKELDNESVNDSPTADHDGGR